MVNKEDAYEHFGKVAGQFTNKEWVTIHAFIETMPERSAADGKKTSLTDLGNNNVKTIE